MRPLQLFSRAVRPTARLLLLCLCPVAVVCGQNRELLGEFTVGIVGRDSDDPIYQAAHLGALDAAGALAREYSIDVEVLVLTPELRSGAGQAASLAHLFVEDADGFILSPADPASVRPAVDFAQRQGQAFVFFETEVPGVAPLASVVADEREAGRLAGEAILAQLPTRGRVAILTAATPSEAHRQRMEGVRDTLGYRRIETVVQCGPDYRSAIAAIREAETTDRNHRIEGWVFLDDWPMQGLPALPWEPGDLPCVAIQSSPTAFLYIEQDYLDALIVHPYYDWGYTSTEMLIEHLHNGRVPEKRAIATRPRVVDWRNIDDYREDWKAWLR